MDIEERWLDKGIFRNSMNTRYLKELFFETTGVSKENVVYTLKDVDHKGYPSLYRLYMDMGDITEYLFATKYFDGFDHWERLSKTSWLQPYITRWRKELALKIEAELVQNFRKIASSDGREAFQANKYLLDRITRAKERPKRGRPTKDEPEDDLIAVRASNAFYGDAANRILNGREETPQTESQEPPDASKEAE